MSGSFKTYPKTILSHNELEYDPNRVDRYGNNFKFMEQHISFKDNVLEEPLESILEIEQINIMPKDKIDEVDNEEIDDEDEKDNDKKLKIDGKVEKPKHRKNSKSKRCSCIIQ
ncbi:hypothetical protein SteCoe_37421 [Stentor coeruleus]|uniref:Uncharacterized protein n=1 Tax=Stentor coeruleus TaxID=5963 RepID=A0A1R2ANE2_9CILI|nr:hypothetical protein SteCoe_37421 [Stentor coeruleus]